MVIQTFLFVLIPLVVVGLLLKLNQIFAIAPDINILNSLKRLIESKISLIKEEIQSLLQELESIREQEDYKIIEFVEISQGIIQDFINNWSKIDRWKYNIKSKYEEIIKNL